MQSLLGQFYSRIIGSQEDIASEGLTYILQRSKSARLAINKIIKSDCGLDFNDLSFLTQNVGINMERPDISGLDEERKEVLIIEAKFWASLTDNQPLEYLKRLHENSVLIFICPALRVRPIFDELHKRIKSTQDVFTVYNDSHSIVFENKRHLIVKSWNEILGTVKLHLVQNNEEPLISDIDQIIGFCNTIDENAFLPIQNEDLSPKYAKRISSYYDLVDKVVDELKKYQIVDTVGLKSTPQRWGYTRYMKTERFGISLNLRFDFWGARADTPFWIIIKEITPQGLWIITNEFRKSSKKIASQYNFIIHEINSRELYFALFPLLNKTEDIVISDLSQQIIKLINALEMEMN